MPIKLNSALGKKKNEEQIAKSAQFKDGFKPFAISSYDCTIVDVEYNEGGNQTKFGIASPSLTFFCRPDRDTTRPDLVDSEGKKKKNYYTDGDGEDQYLTFKLRLNLKKDEESGDIYPSYHEKSKYPKFVKAVGKDCDNAEDYIDSKINLMVTIENFEKEVEEDGKKVNKTIEFNKVSSFGAVKDEKATEEASKKNDQEKKATDPEEVPF